MLCPQDRILVPLSGSLQKISPVLLNGSPLRDGGQLRPLVKQKLVPGKTPNFPAKFGNMVGIFYQIDSWVPGVGVNGLNPTNLKSTLLMVK